MWLAHRCTTSSSSSSYAMHITDHSDISETINSCQYSDSIHPNTLLPDPALALAHHPHIPHVDDLIPLSWPENDRASALDQHSNPIPPALSDNPPPWHSQTLPWPQIHYQYPYPDENTPHPFPYLSLLSIPAHSDIHSATSYSPLSYATAASSPFSFPPSPIPLDHALPQTSDSVTHRYVHPSELSAPAASPQDWSLPNTNAITAHSPLPRTNTSATRSKPHLPAPATRSRSVHPHPTGPEALPNTGESHNPVQHRGEKRKRVPSAGARSRTQGTRARANGRTHHSAYQDQDQSDDDLDNDEDDEDEDDNDDSYSNSSYSPSSSPPPANADATPGVTGAGYTLPRSRTRRTANRPLPLPVPVPHLTKKSRGRKVPSALTHSGLTVGEGTSSASNLTHEDAASAGSNGEGDGTRQRGYICRVPGCGKCFVRGEHLKRHVRSIHTYDKRRLYFANLAS